MTAFDAWCMGYGAAVRGDTYPIKADSFLTDWQEGWKAAVQAGKFNSWDGN